MPYTRQSLVVNHHEAVVLVDAARTWFRVVVDNIAVGLFLYIEDVLTQHARFFCDRCGHPSGTRRQMVRHVVTCHYVQACQEHGAVVASTLRVGVVRSHERRPRMPWRVQSADPRYQ